MSVDESTFFEDGSATVRWAKTVGVFVGTPLLAWWSGLIRLVLTAGDLVTMWLDGIVRFAAQLVAIPFDGAETAMLVAWRSTASFVSSSEAFGFVVAAMIVLGTFFAVSWVISRG